MKNSYIGFDQLLPGMVFVDAMRPNQRLVILKPLPRDLKVWVVKLGMWTPYATGTLAFHASPYTAHYKLRTTEYYLDPNIPGNIPDDLLELSRLGYPPKPSSPAE